jgi:serine phosphatase RsbU (regulator of sigma subunit)
MRMAAEIQTGLLPRGAPTIAGWDLAGSNQPCRTVGGDYYDFALEKGRLLLALGDVSGKGTGAALLMTVLRAAGARALDGAVASPRRSAASTAPSARTCPSSKYVTFFLAALDPETGRLEFVNAGHNPPLLVRATGEVEKLSIGGLVLGIFEGVNYDGGTGRDARRATRSSSTRTASPRPGTPTARSSARTS